MEVEVEVEPVEEEREDVPITGSTVTGGNGIAVSMVGGAGGATVAVGSAGTTST